MSTAVAFNANSQFPIWDDEFPGFFADGIKPPERFRIGAEFEKFAVHPADGRPVRYEEPGGLRNLLQTLCDNHGWEPHHENGHLTTLSRDGATVSLEPGGQVEFATSAVRTLAEIAAQLETHGVELRAAAPHLAFVAAGVHPFAAVEDIPLGIRQRHRVMAEFLPPVAPQALAMMKATASTQATFDFASEADAMAKFTVALKLAPVVNTLWANSSVMGGVVSPHHSARAAVWQGMDPARSGLLLHLLERGPSFASYTAYLLDVPMLFQFIDGEYRPLKDMSFRRYLREGIDGRHPTLGEWETHLTTVFPEARLKHFLEVRGADASPPPLALAVPAFWKGIFYDAATLDATLALVREWSTADLRTLAETTVREGLQARLKGDTVLDWGRRLVASSRRGLVEQAVPGEDRFLDPLQDLLDRATTPSLETRRMSPGELLRYNSY